MLVYIAIFLTTQSRLFPFSYPGPPTSKQSWLPCANDVLQCLVFISSEGTKTRFKIRLKERSSAAQTPSQRRRRALPMAADQPPRHDFCASFGHNALCTRLCGLGELLPTQLAIRVDNRNIEVARSAIRPQLHLNLDLDLCFLSALSAFGRSRYPPWTQGHSVGTPIAAGAWHGHPGGTFAVLGTRGDVNWGPPIGLVSRTNFGLWFLLVLVCVCFRNEVQKLRTSSDLRAPGTCQGLVLR
jgi:hypothetical protein